MTDATSQLDQNILDKMIYVSIEELTTPRQGRTVHVGRFWVVHPEKGAAFYRTRQSPQCNDSEHHVNAWASKFPGHECLKIDFAYV